MATMLTSCQNFFSPVYLFELFELHYFRFGTQSKWWRTSSRCQCWPLALDLIHLIPKISAPHNFMRKISNIANPKLVYAYVLFFYALESFIVSLSIFYGIRKIWHKEHVTELPSEIVALCTVCSIERGGDSSKYSTLIILIHEWCIIFQRIAV